MGGRGALSTTGRKAIGKAVGTLTGRRYKQASGILESAVGHALNMEKALNTSENFKVRDQYAEAKNPTVAKNLGLNDRQRTLRVNKYENAVGEYKSSRRVLENYVKILKKDSTPVPKEATIMLNTSLQPAPRVLKP